MADDNTELNIRWKSRSQTKFTMKENVQSDTKLKLLN